MRELAAKLERSGKTATADAPHARGETMQAILDADVDRGLIVEGNRRGHDRIMRGGP